MSKGLLSLTKEIYFNRSGILLLFVILVAGFFAWLASGSNNSEKEVYIAIATGLLASTLFSFLQTIITGSSHDRLISNSVETSVARCVKDLLDQENKDRKEFLPSRVFAASKEPDKAFNKAVSKEIASSKKLHFRGITGRFAMGRIVKATNVFEEVHVTVADPFASESINARARHMASFVSKDQDFQKEKDAILNDILDAVAGSLKASVRCKKMYIHFTREPVLDRFEMYDNSLYVTLFSGHQQAGVRFPRTLVFDNESSIYKVFASQMIWNEGGSIKSISVTPETSIEDVLSGLNKLGGSISCDEFKAHVKSFDSFLEKNADILI